MWRRQPRLHVRFCQSQSHVPKASQTAQKTARNKSTHFERKESRYVSFVIGTARSLNPTSTEIASFSPRLQPIPSGNAFRSACVWECSCPLHCSVPEHHLRSKRLLLLEASIDPLRQRKSPSVSLFLFPLYVYGGSTRGGPLLNLLTANRKSETKPMASARQHFEIHQKGLPFQLDPLLSSVCNLHDVLYLFFF